MGESEPQEHPLPAQSQPQVKEPSSPEARLQPEDLSLAASQQRLKEESGSSQAQPSKPPELKLSVRKLLGCTPSPPPVGSERSSSPEERRPSPEASQPPIARPTALAHDELKGG